MFRKMEILYLKMSCIVAKGQGREGNREFHCSCMLTNNARAGTNGEKGQQRILTGMPKTWSKKLKSSTRHLHLKTLINGYILLNCFMRFMHLNQLFSSLTTSPLNFQRYCTRILGIILERKVALLQGCSEP